MLDLDDDKTRGFIDAVIWEAKVAQPNLNRRGATPEEAGVAIDAWRSLYLLAEFQRRESEEDRARAISYIEQHADELGLPNVILQLSEFAHNIGHACLMGEDPLGGRRRAGRGETPLTVRIEISAAVQRRRDDGLTLEKACIETSASLIPRRSPDAIRRLYENCMANKATAAIIKLCIAGMYDF